MKHIKLFEQFINEASSKDKRIKEIQDELTDINNEMEDVQDAMDNGDIDQDEAELKLSDLDGFKMELEGELAELQNSSKKKADELGVVQKLLDKFFELNTGSQSHKWAYMVNNVPEEEKRMMASLQKRDQEIEAADVAKAEKIIQKIEKLSKDFSEETKSYISYFITDYINIYRAWGKVAMTLQGANESCKDYEYNCKGIAKIKAECTKKETELKAAKVELNTKRVAVLGI